MATPCDNLRIIGNTTCIDELNRAYNETVLEAQRLAMNGSFDGCETSPAQILSTINHLTNYNIVRIANNAYEEYISSGRKDNSLLVVISVCRDSLKEHEDSDTERELLDNLCDQLSIN